MAEKDGGKESPSAGPRLAERGTATAERAGPGGNGSLPLPPLPARPAVDHGFWLIVIGLVIAAALVVALLAMPGSRSTPEGAPLPDNEFTRIVQSVQGLLQPSSHSLPVVLGKLVLAALLGGIVGYRQRIHVEEYIVQAHVIIAFTGALMMIIIGNELVRAFGLLGAGSIVRYRTPVRDPKALASLFVTMAIGIAIGIGLFELALIGAVLLVTLQGMMGSIASLLPPTLYNPQRAYTLTLMTEDGGRTMVRLKETFVAHDIRYKLLEYDARATKKDDLVKMTLSVEAAASMSTEQLTLLVFRDGVQSISWEEAGE
ncbi:MAG TPA: MgtC/SapB family protein [Chloroflexota bacterium]|nr:MgtC/SapB family protein [Chloroflexota bacterium]